MKRSYTTEELTDALCRREGWVLSELEKLYSGIMKRIADNLSLDKRDTEECISDTLLEVWNTVPPQKPRSYQGYISAIMRRQAIDKIRYHGAKKRGREIYLEAAEELPELCDTEKTVIDTLSIKEALDTFLTRQTKENREIFIRRYYEFESIQSIARDLALSTNTAEKRLSRMRAELKTILKERGYDI
ncbi:MAG: sigma-70 family RNA polymerase sigma factor [Clostridia bacterium]|nr:sigma-70 family RNA polymerase sigma factor [Clostridia bacterium]